MSPRRRVRLTKKEKIEILKECRQCGTKKESTGLFVCTYNSKFSPTILNDPTRHFKPNIVDQ